ncbi:hypothetical protein ACFV4G_15340 [Kitasatospora sp. NPDC059747]|uniref:hypothetical protein n=1 Tax=Kitasatospora sp. NPDC059747 TaxID=3346930 RepID=UPI00365031A1
MLISRSRNAALACTAAVLAAGAALASLTTAQAAPQPPTTSATTTADPAAMPSAIEDFQHPGAARILKDRKISLKQGDGHIRLKEGPGFSVPTDCQAANEIFVESRLDNAGYCFTTTGTSGFLTMELPSVYGIQTADRTVTAKLVAAGQEKKVDIAPNSSEPVGVGFPGGKPTVLVELRVTG